MAIKKTNLSLLCIGGLFEIFSLGFFFSSLSFSLALTYCLTFEVISPSFSYAVLLRVPSSCTSRQKRSVYGPKALLLISC